MPRRLGIGTVKPPQGQILDRAHPLSKQLAYAYVFYGLNNGLELAQPFPTKFTPGSTVPTYGNTLRFGPGWGFSASANQQLNANLTAGWFKNQTYFSVAALVKLGAAPGAASSGAFFQEPVNDSASVRFSFDIVNGANGATGVKWSASFRTGLAASTKRNINGGAGGTAVVAGDEACLVFTFDSVADLYTLYLNGRQEAQLSVAESAIANSNPFSTGTIGTSGFNGTVSAAYVWPGRVLKPNDVRTLSVQPYAMFAAPYRRRIAQQAAAGTFQSALIQRHFIGVGV